MRKIYNFYNICKNYKIVRGVISYAILWPCANLVEQFVVERRTIYTIDWNRSLRFCLFGGLIIGPTMFIWVKIASHMWPLKDLKSSFCKAITEQVAYDPFLISFFLFSMSRWEGNTVHKSIQEVKDKFFATFRVGVIYWPIVQTFNFSYVRQRNQVVFTSFFSMIWTSFLAYMKYDYSLIYK